jgi:hypothetical protein
LSCTAPITEVRLPPDPGLDGPLRAHSHPGRSRCSSGQRSRAVRRYRPLVASSAAGGADGGHKAVALMGVEGRDCAFLDR